MNFEKNKDIYIKQSNDEIILFIHGIFASHVQFHPLIEIFKNKGYSIYAIVLTGHGESYKALKKIKYNDWTEQVNHIIDQLTKAYSKVYVISHSLGSLLVLNSTHVNKVSKAVLLSPAIKPKITLKSIQLALKISSKYRQDHYITENQKIMGIEFKRFYHKVYALKPLIELQKIIHLTKNQLSNYHVDTIIVISKKDESLRISSGQYILDRISSKQKELIVLNQSYHTILHKDEEVILNNRIIDFIKSNH